MPSSAKTARIGSLARKHATYDVWSLGEDSHETVGAEEVKNLSCMVPRKKRDGRLFPGTFSERIPESLDFSANLRYTVPKITTRHIVLSAQPSSPDVSVPEGENVDMSWSTGQNPPRPSYPKELLKHRFMPYGSLAPSKDHASSMDVDSQHDVPPLVSQQPEEEKAVKPKRRKSEGEATKKSKKAKKE